MFDTFNVTLRASDTYLERWARHRQIETSQQ
jgi:hypothetical protein